MMDKVRAFVFSLTFVAIGLAAFFHFHNDGSRTAWTYIINMDGRGYYAYLPAVFIHNDPTYQFHLVHNAQHDDNINFTNEVDEGKRVNKYFVGEAVLLTPFFLVAHVAAAVLGYATNGYSIPYYIAVAFGAIFYVTIGLWLLSLFLAQQFRKHWVSIVVPLLILLGSNLFYYAAYEPSMSHAYSFFLVCVFLFIGSKVVRKSAVINLIALGIVIGLIAITRPVNLVILAMLPFLLRGDNDLPLINLSKIFKSVATVLVAFTAVVSIQLLAYKWQTGQWLVYSYQGEGFNWKNPQIVNTLFSYKRGLFIYAPICLIALVGIKQLWQISSVMALSLTVTLLCAIYVISSWHAWGYGWAYGLRAYVEFMPLFAILLASILARSKPRFVWWFLSLSLLCVTYTQIQTYQVTEKILPLAGVDSVEFWNIFLQF